MLGHCLYLPFPFYVAIKIMFKICGITPLKKSNMRSRGGQVDGEAAPLRSVSIFLAPSPPLGHLQDNPPVLCKASLAQSQKRSQQEGEKGEGKEKERIINVWEKHQLPPAGDRACSPGMCPDWGSRWQSFHLQPGAQPTEPHHPGPKY